MSPPRYYSRILMSRHCPFFFFLIGFHCTLAHFMPFNPLLASLHNRRFMSQARRSRHFVRSARRALRARLSPSLRRRRQFCFCEFFLAHVSLTYLLTYILILVVLQLYRMPKECQLKYILQDIVLHNYKFTTGWCTCKILEKTKINIM